ncbi:hypothetical protein BJ165DRAFT_746047 [Panaeolus papilionaceus]|nr:hypothetical protein BJ165DRAFT_746047 [Panaeolus papilionaceus]
MSQIQDSKNPLYLRRYTDIIVTIWIQPMGMSFCTQQTFPRSKNAPCWQGSPRFTIHNSHSTLRHSKQSQRLSSVLCCSPFSWSSDRTFSCPTKNDLDKRTRAQELQGHGCALCVGLCLETLCPNTSTFISQHLPHVSDTATLRPMPYLGTPGHSRLFPLSANLHIVVVVKRPRRGRMTTPGMVTLGCIYVLVEWGIRRSF